MGRFAPYFEETIVPDLKAGKTVLIVAHGNSLRALVKYLDGMSDEAVVGLNIPTGNPLRYDLDDDLKPLNPGGTYLDPEAAAAGAAAVAAQGGVGREEDAALQRDRHAGAKARQRGHQQPLLAEGVRDLGLSARAWLESMSNLPSI